MHPICRRGLGRVLERCTYSGDFRSPRRTALSLTLAGVRPRIAAISSLLWSGYNSASRAISPWLQGGGLIDRQHISKLFFKDIITRDDTGLQRSH